MNVCDTCKGIGVVLVDLRMWRLGEGAMALLSAGCPVRYGDDGSTHHEIVCPKCNGKPVGDEDRQ